MRIIETRKTLSIIRGGDPIWVPRISRIDTTSLWRQVNSIAIRQINIDLEIIQERNRNAAAGRNTYNNLDLVDHDGLALDPPIAREEVDDSRIHDQSYQQEERRPTTSARQ